MGRRVPQREFIVAVCNESGVVYEYPGQFRAGALEITIPPRRIAAFALRLSEALTFDAYDRLARAAYVAHLGQRPSNHLALKGPGGR
jgi:hypothetical protein